MGDYCKDCIHFALQKVICQTDKGEQVLYEPACMAVRCKREVKKNG